ncbi:GGDEF domain-containing protein [Inhella gelatinilytica]|uniref:diguanylate cyclase n=1 Tax=Inhella gelatinilytica TaxID=2795030 RepID=A0A931NE15_9BURK|nr:GGDEF domain-containing protein [Inhella gelatinilytica]MBH9553204.1 GGDEF domain-containing protein [Inhella gelatinilytica]
MSKVVEQLAELTGYKDRDVIDVTLVVALKDLLGPEGVSIYRAVGPAGDQRWMTRAQLAVGQVVPRADALTGRLESLPGLDTFPVRLACLQRRELLETQAGDLFVCCFPLVSEHDGDGVLEVTSSQHLTKLEKRTVSAILRVFHNFQGLLDYSERDSLTGLLNRKTFDSSFLKLLGESPGLPVGVSVEDRRHEARASYWLGVIDIDHFKRVNDGFGHLIGDEVLLLLSRLMRTCFRYHDRLYRFGGEEFVVLIRCDEGEEAQAVFERLRQQCEAFAFPQVGRVTLSIGFTHVRNPDTPTASFDRADKAVYHAKHSGRNQVWCYERLVEAGVLTEEVKKDSDIELF